MSIKLEEKFNRFYERLVDEANTSNWKSLTPEQRQEQFYERNGFNKNGKTWIVIGNTFSVKEDIKSKGGKWNQAIKHWVMPEKDNQFNYYSHEVDVASLFDKNAYGEYDYRLPKFPEGTMKRVSDEEAKLAKQTSQANGINSQFVGTPGQPVSINVKSFKYISSYMYQASFYNAQEMRTYDIIDTDGNYYRWNTSIDVESRIPLNDIKTLNGKVKEHRTISGIDYTIITNCKINGASSKTPVKNVNKSTAQSGNPGVVMSDMIDEDSSQNHKEFRDYVRQSIPEIDITFDSVDKGTIFVYIKENNKEKYIDAMRVKSGSFEYNLERIKNFLNQKGYGIILYLMREKGTNSNNNISGETESDYSQLTLDNNSTKNQDEFRKYFKQYFPDLGVMFTDKNFNDDDKYYMGLFQGYLQIGDDCIPVTEGTFEDNLRNIVNHYGLTMPDNNSKENDSEESHYVVSGSSNDNEDEDDDIDLINFDDEDTSNNDADDVDLIDFDF